MKAKILTISFILIAILTGCTSKEEVSLKEPRVKSKYDTPRAMYQTFLMDEAIKELDVEIENYKH